MVEDSPEQEEALPVEVYVAANQLEAQVVRGLLESKGIPAILRYESVGLVYGLTVDGMGETRVMVAPDLATRARGILAAHSRAAARDRRMQRRRMRRHL